MKIVFLYFLLIYQLLQHSDATDQCRPLSEFMGTPLDSQTTVPTTLGSDASFIIILNQCNDSSNNSYVLLHLNHHTGELEIVPGQSESKFIVQHVQLSTLGIYCIYQQCAPQYREQCCVRVIEEQPEVEIIFPRRVQANVPEEGVCYAKTWPQPEMSVNTNSSCAITTKPLRIINTYTTAMFFTLININSPCLITCVIGNNYKRQIIDIDPVTTTPLITTISPTTTTYSVSISTSYIPHSITITETITTTVTPTIPTCTSGVLGIYRITLWIIVLTLTILSTAINSLVPGFL